MTLYAWRGMHIFDEGGEYLATLLNDLEGRSVRWDAYDFVQDDPNRIDFKDPKQAARLTAALTRLHKAAGKHSIDTDWIV